MNARSKGKRRDSFVMTFFLSLVSVQVVCSSFVEGMLNITISLHQGLKSDIWRTLFQKAVLFYIGNGFFDQIFPMILKWVRPSLWPQGDTVFFSKV